MSVVCSRLRVVTLSGIHCLEGRCAKRIYSAVVLVLLGLVALGTGSGSASGSGIGSGSKSSSSSSASTENLALQRILSQPNACAHRLARVLRGEDEPPVPLCCFPLASAASAAHAANSGGSAEFSEANGDPGGFMGCCGWTKSISHHEMKAWDTIVCWYLQGIIHHSRVS